MKFVIIISVNIFFLMAGCHSGKKESNGIISPGEVIQIDSLPGQCPYLTKDAKRNAVLSWVRMADDSTFSFCYAVAKDGKAFGNPIEIPHSSNIQPHGENLPKIIFKPSGEIIALWGTPSTNLKNKYSGMVSYSQSFDDGKTWTSPKPLVADTAGYDQRYYDVSLLPDGEVGIIWLDNRKTTKQEGSSLYFARTEGKNGFRHERSVAESCCQCCRTDLFVDSKGAIHVLYRGIIQDSIRDMVHAVSIDGGKTFSLPRRVSDDNWVLNACPHTGPAMAENNKGLHFAWFTGGSNKGTYYARTSDNGKNFTPRDGISGLGSHPQIAALKNGELIIAWDESVTVGNKSVKRIGVQRRTDEGIASEKTFITPETSTASYPVVLPLNGNASVIAYSRKSGDKNYIECQVVNVN